VVSIYVVLDNITMKVKFTQIHKLFIYTIHHVSAYQPTTGLSGKYNYLTIYRIYYKIQVMMVDSNILSPQTQD